MGRSGGSYPRVPEYADGGNGGGITDGAGSDSRDNFGG